MIMKISDKLKEFLSDNHELIEQEKFQEIFHRIERIPYYYRADVTKEFLLLLQDVEFFDDFDKHYKDYVLHVETTSKKIAQEFNVPFYLTIQHIETKKTGIDGFMALLNSDQYFTEFRSEVKKDSQKLKYKDFNIVAEDTDYFDVWLEQDDNRSSIHNFNVQRMFVDPFDVYSLNYTSKEFTSLIKRWKHFCEEMSAAFEIMERSFEWRDIYIKKICPEIESKLQLFADEKQIPDVKPETTIDKNRVNVTTGYTVIKHGYSKDVGVKFDIRSDDPNKVDTTSIVKNICLSINRSLSARRRSLAQAEKHHQEQETKKQQSPELHWIDGRTLRGYLETSGIRYWDKSYTNNNTHSTTYKYVGVLATEKEVNTLKQMLLQDNVDVKNVELYGNTLYVRINC